MIQNILYTYLLGMQMSPFSELFVLVPRLDRIFIKNVGHTCCMYTAKLCSVFDELTESGCK